MESFLKLQNHLWKKFLQQVCTTKDKFYKKLIIKSTVSQTFVLCRPLKAWLLADASLAKHYCFLLLNHNNDVTEMISASRLYYKHNSFNK